LNLSQDSLVWSIIFSRFAFEDTLESLEDLLRAVSEPRVRWMEFWTPSLELLFSGEGFFCNVDVGEVLDNLILRMSLPTPDKTLPSGEGVCGAPDPDGAGLPSSKNLFWLDPKAYGQLLTPSWSFFGEFPDDFALRLDRVRPGLGPHGLLEVDRGVLGDGVGGGETEEVSDVPSSEDLRPRSPK
jgi:hypothetical protein